MFPKNKIGVMQGRLLHKYKNRFQAHPVGYWQEEFPLAQKLGLDCIEFILDLNDINFNPLMSKDGLGEIKNLINQTNIGIDTICADYLMECPLHCKDELIAEQAQKILLRLLKASVELGVTDIVIPCVDQSSIKGIDERKNLVKRIKEIKPILEELKINLALETDLDPYSFVELNDSIDSNFIKVNYDIGNSASLGFDINQELNAYGEIISDIHIKDRLLGGNSVFLGEGDANFDQFFQALKRYKYKGPFIMQAYRDDNGLEVFKKQLKWIKPYLKG